MDGEEWFKLARVGSGVIRAQQETRERLAEVLNCDDCQTPEGYKPCDLHPADYVSKEDQ